MNTKHADKRTKQRGVPRLILDWLFNYGAVRHDKHGAEIRFFDKTARRRLERDCGRAIVRKLSEYLNCYAVFQDGTLITAGRRYRPLHTR